MHRDICYHHVKFTDGVNITAQALQHHELMCGLGGQWLYVVWSVHWAAGSLQLSSWWGGGGADPPSSCFLFIQRKLNLSVCWFVRPSSPAGWGVWQRDGGWTGRVRADCLSVMNINGLQVCLSSSGSPSLKAGMGPKMQDGGCPSSSPPS